MTQPRHALTLWLGLVGPWALGGCAGGGNGPDVVVDTTVRYQTIVGWEAHEQSGHDDASFPLFRDELFDRAANELGINRIRLEAWAGAEASQDNFTRFRNGEIDAATWRCVRFSTENDNDDPAVIEWGGFHFTKIDRAVRDVVLPMQERLRARGEELHVNLLYDAFTQQICGDRDYHHHDAAEYAEFILAHFIHLRDEFGLVPQSLELILEPDNSTWASRGEELGAAVVATVELLRAHGFEPRIIAPSLAAADRVLAYLDDMARVPGAVELVDEIAYHRYDRPSASTVRAIRDRAEGLGAQTAMLEWLAGADQYTLREDLIEGGVSAWQQFALAYPQDEGPPYDDTGEVYYIIDVQQPDHPRVVLSERARYLSQYFRYVRAGAVRIEATSSRRNVEPVAFVSSSGDPVVVVNVRGSRAFEVGGLPPGTYDVVYTTEDELHASGGSVTIGAGEMLPVSMPGTGVVTVVGRGAA